MLKNPKHERFCQAVAAGKLNVEAYEIAGYHPLPDNANRGNACNLRKRPDISARIAELAEAKQAEFVRETVAADIAAIEESGITRATLLRDAEEIKRRCMQLDPVRERDGKPLMVETQAGEVQAGYVFNAAGALKALELQARLTGHLINRTTIEPTTGALPPERRTGREVARSVLGEIEQAEKEESVDHADGAYTHASTRTLQ